MGGSKGKLVLYKEAPREVWPIFLHFVDFSFLFETCLIKFAQGYR